MLRYSALRASRVAAAARYTQVLRNNSWGSGSECRHVASAAGPEVKHALIQGSSRGLGLEIVTQLLQREDHKVIATCRSPSTATQLQALKTQYADRLIIEQMDITKPEEITACAASVEKQVPYLSLLFNVSGLLHIPGPETSPTRPATSETENQYLEPVRYPRVAMMQAFEKLLVASAKHGTTDEAPAIVANVSARVGSIGDNQLGGWYSYRASKTALNQLTKTMSLEFKRRKRKVACVLLHPGTCETDLSAPFQKNVPEGKLFSRERGARQLIGVAESVTMANTGAYLAWDGQPIPWNRKGHQIQLMVVVELSYADHPCKRNHESIHQQTGVRPNTCALITNMLFSA